MQIEPTSRSAVNPPERVRAPEAPAARVSEDDVNFRAVDALNRAAQGQPEIRADEVSRALELTANVQYPPSKIIRSLGRLLANHL